MIAATCSPSETAAPSTEAVDPDALVLRHLSLVKIIVAKMRSNLPPHTDFEELESAGTMGLISAARLFDPSRGYTFETYASIRIRGAILDELRKLDMMPRSVRSKTRKLQQTVQVLEQRLGRAPNDHEIRDELGLKEKKYRRMRAQTEPITVVHLDRSPDGSDLDLHEVIRDDTQRPCFERVEKAELYELVADKIEELPEQQRKVLALYFHEEMRLAEIGQVLGVSEARVSQIRSQALGTLRKFVRRMSH